MNDRVNQQEILSQGEIGWLAGIIEGEGTIAMNIRKKKLAKWNGIGMDLTIAIVNSDGGIIEKASNLFRKIGIEPLIYELSNQPLYNKNGKVYVNPAKKLLRLSVNRLKDILLCLEICVEHLAGEKKARARLMIDFIARRLSRKPKHNNGGKYSWYDKQDWDIVKKFYELCNKTIKPEFQKTLRDYTCNTA